VLTRRGLMVGALAVASLAIPAAARAQDSDWIVAAIYAAADRYGVSRGWLLSTAMCESNLDPNAVNPVTGDSGLFQFNPNTWAAWGGGDIWSVYDQADKAAWAFSQGLSGHWLCS
jgi:soluble lytic murein transglycosylase-like protein